ncbi:hypothetical protein F4604DRAFT_1936793 [Suillus subluteus]|nr:hypothetical protein F4604DRAFT_1936793 [Suillus subluteus]
MPSKAAHAILFQPVHCPRQRAHYPACPSLQSHCPFNVHSRRTLRFAADISPTSLCIVLDSKLTILLIPCPNPTVPSIIFGIPTRLSFLPFSFSLCIIFDNELTILLVPHPNPTAPSMFVLSMNSDEKSRHMQELLTEAQLEAGHDSLETMDFGDETYDDSSHVDDLVEDEPVGGPLPSEFFKMCTREQDPQLRRRIDEQILTLVDAYLAWKHRAATVDDNTVTSNIFHVNAVGIMDFTRAVTIQQLPNEPANAALLRVGLLGCSPLQPTIAIHIQCLELYHQIRRCQASFSIQAITKVLCTLHNATYFQQLCEQFSNVFDVYLQILREVQSHVDRILGKDSDNWQMNGACLPCAFKQPDEPMLSPAQLHAMDGNFSAKRLDGSGSADPRLFCSQYFISEADVDQFKDDVRRQTGESANSTTLGACTENWTAAKAVDDDKITVFDQTGIFLVACRHGIIECVTEMKRSGELVKYSLAALNRLLEVCGADQAIGHDIACSSRKTIATSSIGAKATELNLQVVVNAFHSFSHDRRCQLRNHPLYLSGLGLEDLETCERIFASSNSTAVLIRHASYFHWMQFLDLHFDQWDMDRYTDLSIFLYNNYVQALRIIETDTPVLEEFKWLHSLMDTDFINWQNKEYDYLCEVAMEPTSDAITVAYVEQLEKLYYVEATYGHLTTVPFLTYTPTNFTRTSGLNVTSCNSSKVFESEHASVICKYELQLNVVEDFELRHGITERWLPHDPKYVQAAQYSQERQFIRSVEELEGLVVRRLFELSKANLAGTGYKMRKYISKAITRRSAAIRTALEKYNKLAPLQNPPRPVLDYSEIVGYASLGEFSLLKHSRHDILTKPWTVSTNREMATKYFKLSWVKDEDRTISEAIDSLLANDPESLLVAELQIYYAKRHRINNIHRKRLQRIYTLNQYTGERPTTNHTVTAPDEDRDDEGDLDNHEDVVNEEAVRLEDLVSSDLTL